MVRIHKRLNDRIEWLKGLWTHILTEVKDEDIAKVIYKRVVFEEE